jgi:hypothetical protein
LAETANRLALINSLSLFAARHRMPVAKSFLDALSFDELLFVAEVVGSCILISRMGEAGTWDIIGPCATVFRNASGEEAHRLMVLTEFACCCGVALKFGQGQLPVPTPSVTSFERSFVPAISHHAVTRHGSLKS